ncbi:hypothetical protein BPNPMPFG_000220 [Mesorhizobium sp. AR07]|uniref:hypothetical protein n=1 Tax=Mesorhizobium sp. AR07 TaxID=2865838 RepID=UPI00215F9A75|nr:hypothetical protein [Mesorhizobium sp. AR07]UVK44761.1 hypothetical protein BPNPMPFG_000220 [Mesorhizobium sp. AR07]
MGTAKEYFANERIAENEAVAARANEAAANANARALEAQLALERFKAPRALSSEQQRDIANRMSKWAVLEKSGEKQSIAVFSVSDSMESKWLANQLAEILGPDGAKCSINRNSVMYGASYNVRGVGLLISSSPRGAAVATDLLNSLTENGISAFIVPQRRSGCAEMKGEEDKDDTNPWCSSISLMVGEKPS